jgi:hypothetical protein
MRWKGVRPRRIWSSGSKTTLASGMKRGLDVEMACHRSSTTSTHHALRPSFSSESGSPCANRSPTRLWCNLRLYAYPIADPTHAARGNREAPRIVAGPWLSASSAIRIRVCRYNKFCEPEFLASLLSNCAATHNSQARLGFAGVEFVREEEDGFERTAAYNASNNASRIVIDAAASRCRKRGFECGRSGNVGWMRL